MPPAYHFVTVWDLDAPAEAIYDVLADPLDLPRWWPSVYLAVRQLHPPPEKGGVGGTYSLYTRGWLPYTLRWTLATTMAERPSRLGLAATGDFDGTGLWTLAPHGAGTRVTFDWRIVANKPLLRLLSPILRPVFSANHEWAMRQGLVSLREELGRRARTDASPSTVVRRP